MPNLNPGEAEGAVGDVKVSEAGKAPRGARLRAAVRGAPRALYEELWSEPADRVPRMGEADAPVWRPVFLVLLVIAAVGIMVIRTVELSPTEQRSAGRPCWWPSRSPRRWWPG